MGVSVSLLNRWLDCREQCRLSYIEGWKAKTPHPSFTFGSCVHHVLERSYALKKPPKQIQIVEFISEYEHKWHKENPNAEDPETVEKMLGLAETVMPFYFLVWGEADWKREWLFREERFRQPIEVSHPSNNSSIEIDLVGVIDTAFRQKGDQNWIMENKTGVILDEEEIAGSLPYIHQTMLYAWVLGKILGEKTRGILWNFIRRPAHRQKVSESLKEFLARVKEEITKKPEHFFHRWAQNLFYRDIERYLEKQLLPTLRELVRWAEGKGEHYMNPNALKTKYGKSVYFNAICHNDYTYLEQGPLTDPAFVEYMNASTKDQSRHKQDKEGKEKRKRRNSSSKKRAT